MRPMEAVAIVNDPASSREQLQGALILALALLETAAAREQIYAQQFMPTAAIDAAASTRKALVERWLPAPQAVEISSPAAVDGGAASAETFSDTGT